MHFRESALSRPFGEGRIEGSNVHLSYGQRERGPGPRRKQRHARLPVSDRRGREGLPRRQQATRSLVTDAGDSYA